MADSESESDFLGFATSDFQTDSDAKTDLYSDVIVSDVSSNDLGLSDELSESSDSNDASVSDAGKQWTTDLTSVTPASFSETTGATFQLPTTGGELDFFERFFPATLLTEIVAETNRYAAECITKKPDPSWRPTETKEFQAFLGLHLILSVVPMPSHKLAWTKNCFFRHPSFGEIMTRERFEKLLKYMHVHDARQNPARGTPGHDRLCLVRSVIDTVNNGCIGNYLPNKQVSVDEAMIAYKGRLSFKQYLPAKPTKFGVKVWVRADPSNGYVNEFDIYTGKSSQEPAEGSLGERVVKKLRQRLYGKNHHVYMDNYFSSPKLFADLLHNGVYCCGTVRLNRKDMPPAIQRKQLVRKQGDFAIFQKGALTATAWKNKKQVNFLATNCDPTEVDTVQRRQKDGSSVDTVCPVVCKQYSAHMFGVDRADQMRMQYSTCRKAVKWWKYIFWFLFDVCVCNAFVCMRESPNHKLTTRMGKLKPRTQTDFRMKLSEQMIGSFRGRRKRKSLPTPDLAGFAHWPVKVSKRGRCKRCYDQKHRHEVTMKCEQCQIYRCIDNDCFKKHHTELLSTAV